MLYFFAKRKEYKYGTEKSKQARDRACKKAVAQDGTSRDTLNGIAGGLQHS